MAKRPTKVITGARSPNDISLNPHEEEESSLRYPDDKVVYRTRAKIFRITLRGKTFKPLPDGSSEAIEPLEVCSHDGILILDAKRDAEKIALIEDLKEETLGVGKQIWRIEAEEEFIRSEKRSDASKALSRLSPEEAQAAIDAYHRQALGREEGKGEFDLESEAALASL